MSYSYFSESYIRKIKGTHRPGALLIITRPLSQSVFLKKPRHRHIKLRLVEDFINDKSNSRIRDWLRQCQK
jgi:hypothetical protein